MRLSFGMPMPPREKRSAKVQGYVPESLREFCERLIAGHPNKTMSDVVFEALELKRVMVIAQQKVGSDEPRN